MSVELSPRELLAVCSWILSFGSGAEVIEPQSLRGQVARELSDGLRRYEKKTGSPRGTRGRPRRASA